MASNNDKERRADGGAVETRFAAVLAAAAKRNPETTLKLGDFTSPPITSVDDLIEKVDAQNERFTQFREKRHAIFGAMATALKPIEMVGEVVSGAASEVFAPSSSVFSAAMYLVNAANDVSSTYDNILQLFEKLKVRPHPSPTSRTNRAGLHIATRRLHPTRYLPRPTGQNHRDTRHSFRSIRPRHE